MLLHRHDKRDEWYDVQLRPSLIGLEGLVKRFLLLALNELSLYLLDFLISEDTSFLVFNLLIAIIRNIGVVVLVDILHHNFLFHCVLACGI